jgi:ribonuclease BN (tRNA processing enzyme)
MINHFSTEFEKVLLSLRIIFITHVHSDHYLGILNLISERKKLCEKYKLSDNIFLIIPYNLAPAIWAYDEYV